MDTAFWTKRIALMRESLAKLETGEQRMFEEDGTDCTARFTATLKAEIAYLEARVSADAKGS